MKAFTFCLLILLTSFITAPVIDARTTSGDGAGRSPVEIWSYGFVTVPAGAKEPISGDGSSIFKRVGGEREGPIRAHDGTDYRLRLVLNGESATAVLTADKNVGLKIELQGPVTETPESDGDGCSLVVRLTGGANFVLLQRYVDKCGSR